MNNRHDWRTVEQSASGRWFEILEAHGIETRKLNKNGPCPTCGGHDRAHFFERDGRTLLYCRHGCGNAGDGNCVSTPEHLLMEHNRWSFPELVNTLGEYLGTTPAASVSHSSRASTASINYPPSHTENPTKAAADLSKALDAETHQAFLRWNTAPYHPIKTMGNCVAAELLNSAGELVNVAAINADGRVFYSAGGISYGATHRIPARETPVRRVLCQEYFDAWRIWWSLKGECEVRVAVSPDNFVWVARKLQSEFDSIAVYEDDTDEYRERGLDVVVIPDLY